MSSCPNCDSPEHFSDDVSNTLNARDYVYDIETYPNAFTCRFIHVATGMNWRFEISDQVNQIESFISFIYNLRDQGARMVGYNNVGFDYPVIHFIVTNPWVSVTQIYDRAMTIINAHGPAKFSYMIWDSDRIVEQLDLYKICHFDNVARATSLKSLEIAMRMKNVADLPFPVGTMLSPEQITELHRYNMHDVVATTYFYIRTLPAIKLREELSVKYNRNFMNHNDTKIGKDYFIMELEKNGVECFMKVGRKRAPRQTIRPWINFNDVILPYIQFKQPEFNRVLNELKNMIITETRGSIKNLSAVVDGFSYDFGTGGIHGCVSPQILRTTDTHVIIDIDYKSYYPNLSITNGFYPEHLGPVFCDIYSDVYQQRILYAGGTAENKMLKLALNGVYGDSNNIHSPFYDPKFTMSITINGQLLLCLLAEQLLEIPELEMVFVNTDGLCCRLPCEHEQRLYDVCRDSDKQTGLTLEFQKYKMLAMRDVNNYIGVTMGGSIKRRGAYEYVAQWHQDPSALVVGKTAEAFLVHGTPIEEFIRDHNDPFDFMCRAKVPRASHLVMRWTMGDDHVDMPLANIVRYFVSVDGGALVKISPPTGKPGTWKRKPRVDDGEYDRVVIEIKTFASNIDAMGGVPSAEGIMYDGVFTHWDTDGIVHDERIHTRNRSTHETREMSIQAGLLVTDCSNADLFDWSAINYDWYIDQVKKLVDCYPLKSRLLTSQK
ncbi:MAG: hypothetical protein KAR42_11115 [candidate division Zixibacteria bacterium]|nr:hypothetical protein [candidate division Zixibacteria bacterium]